MKIYIGNLSFSTTEDQLKNAFSDFGEVESVNIIKDKETDKSKGFAFVEIENAENALNAIEAMNGKLFDGRKLRVNQAKEMPPRKNRRY